QQNLQVAAGQIGEPPVAKWEQFQLTINTLGRLIDPDQFGDIIIKVGQGGPGGAQLAQVSAIASSVPSAQNSGAGGIVPQATSIVRLRVVARAGLGVQQYYT